LLPNIYILQLIIKIIYLLHSTERKIWQEREICFLYFISFIVINFEKMNNSVEFTLNRCNFHQIYSPKFLYNKNKKQIKNKTKLKNTSKKTGYNLKLWNTLISRELCKYQKKYYYNCILNYFFYIYFTLFLLYFWEKKGLSSIILHCTQHDLIVRMYMDRKETTD